MSTPGVWDAGLQPERTSLAWQRTGITLLGLGVLIPRVAWSVLDLWSLLPTGIVLAAAIAVLVAARRRYRAAHRILTEGAGHLHDGRLPSLVALTGLALGVLAFALLFARR